MNLLNKLTKKNLKLNKKRTIVTIIGIMLSVALITAIASVYLSGVGSLTDYLRKKNGNFHANFYGVPANKLDDFKENRNIETINIVKSIGYAKIESKNDYKPYANVQAFTKNSLENLGIRLIDGRLPEKDDEILIPSHLETNGRLFLKVGSTIDLQIGKRIDLFGEELNQNYSIVINSENTIDEKIIETKTKTYKVVGITERPSTVIEPSTAPGYTFITFMDSNNITDNVDVYLRFNLKNESDCFKYIANILEINPEIFLKGSKMDNITSDEYDLYFKELEKAKYKFGINYTLVLFEINPIANSGIIGLGTAALVVMGIVVFASVFCIKNSFDISITEKIKQYGMLKSVGATKKQIKKNVFYEGAILGVIGIPLGIILGFVASYLLIIISNFYMRDMLPEYFVLKFIFSPLATIVAIILGIITIYFSASRSAKKASKISPIDSIRNSANIKIESKKIKTPKIIKKVFGIGGEISLKNLKRNKKKYRTTVISIIVSTFVFIALSSFMDMLYREIKNQYSTTDYNLYISYSNFNKDMYDKFYETTKFDSVLDSTISKTIYVEIEGNHYSKEYIELTNITDESYETIIPVLSIGKDQFKKYAKSLGVDYEYIKDKGILLDTINHYELDDNNNRINKKFREFNYNKGDFINFRVTESDIKYDLEVGIVTDLLPFGIQKDRDTMMIVEDELLEKLGSSRYLNVYYNSSDANKLQTQIEEFFKDENINIYNVNENVKMVNNFYILIGIFLYGFIIVVSLIGITTVFNTITTNMELRKREFAMLKSIGMTKKEFNRMIRLETIFMGLKSLLYSIPIGILLSYLLYSSIAKGSSQTYALPLNGIMISIVVVFLLISLIMSYSIRKINKQNTIETIRNENI